MLQIENVISGVRDSNLKLMLAFGIGIHHAGLVERDRKSVEELFVNQRIQVWERSTQGWELPLDSNVSPGGWGGGGGGAFSLPECSPKKLPGYTWMALTGTCWDLFQR